MVNKTEEQFTKKNSFLMFLKNTFGAGGDKNLKRLFVVMGVVFILMVALNPSSFLTMRNFTSMSFQMPEFGILAIAMMIAMLSGGIDLSIVGTANLSGVVAGLILVKLVPKDAGLGHTVMILLLCVLVSAVIGMLCGAFNGFAVSKIGIPPILTTLGTLQLFMGIAIVITKGKAVLGFPEIVSSIGNGKVGPIPVPMLIFIAFAIVFSIILKKTSYGLKLYMLGTNPKAAIYSGINNTRVLIRTYMYSGVLAAMAGLIIIARTNSAKADFGTSYTLQAVLVSVMGGVNPNGGFGKIMGIVMAMFTLQFLSSGFNMLHFSNFLKDFMWGLVLLVVMVVNYIIDNLNTRKQIKSKTN